MSEQHYCSPVQRQVDMSTSTAPDPAFEPHSTYMFDELSAEEELRNMKHNITTINMATNAESHENFGPIDALT